MIRPQYRDIRYDTIYRAITSFQSIDKLIVNARLVPCMAVAVSDALGTMATNSLTIELFPTMYPLHKPQYLQYVYHLSILKSLPGAHCTPIAPLQLELCCIEYCMVCQHKR